MSFAQHIQDIRRRYRPGDPLAIQAFMQRCGLQLQRVVRRALRTDSSTSRLAERIRAVAARLNGGSFGSNRAPQSVSLVCQRLCATLLWGDSESAPHCTELFADTWLDAAAGARG
jgi:hypothetical protein